MAIVKTPRFFMILIFFIPVIFHPSSTFYLSSQHIRPSRSGGRLAVASSISNFHDNCDGDYHHDKMRLVVVREALWQGGGEAPTDAAEKRHCAPNLATFITSWPFRLFPTLQTQVKLEDKNMISISLYYSELHPIPKFCLFYLSVEIWCNGSLMANTHTIPTKKL